MRMRHRTHADVHAYIAGVAEHHDTLHGGHTNERRLFNETLHENLDIPTIDRLIAEARQVGGGSEH